MIGPITRVRSPICCWRSIGRMFFGRFLEFSIATRDIRASVQFYEELGFRQLLTGDIWQHRYGVLTDGRLVIGLHERRGADFSITFVQPDLASHVPAWRAAGFEPHFTRLGTDDFHEVQLQDPSGTDIVALEARTFSPGAVEPGSTRPACGRFTSCSIPALEPEATQQFWERAGCVAHEALELPYEHRPLIGKGLELALHRPGLFDRPLLTFRDPQMGTRLRELAARGIEPSPDLPRELKARGHALLLAPEGTQLLLLKAAI
jgi:catechol 2,3-dioxygenase-like lactoylglutathione lyase family enzyme